jgi:hypothetical protein
MTVSFLRHHQLTVTWALSEGCLCTPGEVAVAKMKWRQALETQLRDAANRSSGSVAEEFRDHFVRNGALPLVGEAPEIELTLQVGWWGPLSENSSFRRVDPPPPPPPPPHHHHHHRRRRRRRRRRRHDRLSVVDRQAIEGLTPEDLWAAARRFHSGPTEAQLDRAPGSFRVVYVQQPLAQVCRTGIALVPRWAHRLFSTTRESMLTARWFFGAGAFAAARGRRYSHGKLT